MIKRILFRSEQAFKYFTVNLLMALRKTKKIKLLGFSSSIYLRANTSDLLTFHQIFTFNNYNIKLRFLPQTIIDAGANIGLATVYFNNKYPNATIVSIEPEGSNFEMLKKNSEGVKNVILHKRALSNKSNLFLNVIDKGHGNWGFVTEIVNHTGCQNIVDIVKTITIDEIINENNWEYIDLLKIDIEGAEKELFESDYENWLPKTKCIIIEFHDAFNMGSSKSFFKAISRYNFSSHKTAENFLFINEDILYNIHC